MDTLGSDNLSVSMNMSVLQSGQWNNYSQRGIGALTNGDSYSTDDGKIDETEGFLEAYHDFLGFKAFQNSSNSINAASVSNLCKRQGSIMLVADTMVAKSRSRDAGSLTAELCSSQIMDHDKPYMIGNRTEGYDNEVGFQTTGSLDSLECLIPGNSSSTGTSVEDDGVSMLLSDCRNLWDFASGNAVSLSGESDNNLSNNLHDERSGSQSSSNPGINNAGPSNTRPSSSKRRRGQRDHNETNENYDQGFDLLQSNYYTTEAGFQVRPENPPRSKKIRLEKHDQMTSSTISFQQPDSSLLSFADEPDTEAIAQMKEMIYRAAALRPVNLGLEVVEKPKRKNVRISSDPQTVAARQRRERVSERIRVLQKLVPGGSKMDTASMLDEAANYLKFLRSQVKALETLGGGGHHQLKLPFSPLSQSPLFSNTFPMQTTLFSFPKP